MVLTVTQNLSQYAALSPRFSKAFAALDALAREPFVPGRHPVDGDSIYINALQYDTHPREAALMEAHRRYIDVMWLVSGREQIEVCPVEALTEVTQPYDPSGDALLAKLPRDVTRISMQPGSVCILFPKDGHAPGLHDGAACPVRKLIAKVLVD